MNNTSNFGANNTGMGNNINMSPGVNPVGPQPILPGVGQAQPVQPINNQMVNTNINPVMPNMQMQGMMGTNNMVAGSNPAVLGGNNFSQPVIPQQPILNQPIPQQVNNSTITPQQTITPVVPNQNVTVPPVMQAPIAQAPVQNSVVPTSLPQEPATNAVTPVLSNPTLNQGTQVLPTAQNVVNQAALPVAPVQNNSVGTNQAATTSPMPILPNVDDLIASAPVVTENNQVSVPEVKKTEAQVELNVNSDVKIDIKPKKEDKKKEKQKQMKDVTDDDYDEEEFSHSNRAPMVMAGIFVSMLIIVFVYYFVIMTPQKVFDKAIDTTVDYFKGFLTGVEDSNKKMKFDLGFVLNTDNRQFEDEVAKGWHEPIDYILDDYLKGIIYFDTSKQDGKVELQAYKKLDNFKKININGKPVIDSNGEYSDKELKTLIENGQSTIDSQFISGSDRSNYTKMLDFNIYSVGTDKKNEEGKTEKEIFVGPIEYINYNNLDKYIDEYGKKKFVANNVISGMQKQIIDQIFSKLDSGDNPNENEDLKVFKNSLKDTNFSLSYDTVNSVVNVAEITKNKIVDIIQNEELQRSIVTKKIDKTTTIALKAHTYVDYKRIKEIYSKIFEDYENDVKEKLVEVDKETNKEVEKEISVLDEFAKIFGVNKDAVKHLMKYLKGRDVVTNSVEVNLYMNLANTDLIALDVCIDNKYYVEINSLNGYFKINIKASDEEGKDVREESVHKSLDIIAVYDRTNGIVDGRGIIDNENTFVTVTFKYVRTEKEGEKIGNSLTLGFYKDTRIQKLSEEEIYDLMSEENIKKIISKDSSIPAQPFCILRCDLQISDNSEENLTEEEIKNTNFDLVEEVTHKKSGDDDTQATGVQMSNVSGDFGKNRYGYNIDDITGVFLPHFTSHVNFLVDHLLFNKVNAIEKHSESKEEKKVVKEETKKEDNQKTDDKTNKSDNNENKNTENETVINDTSSTDIKTEEKEDNTNSSTENQ